MGKDRPENRRHQRPIAGFPACSKMTLIYIETQCGGPQQLNNAGQEWAAIADSLELFANETRRLMLDEQGS